MLEETFPPRLYDEVAVLFVPRDQYQPSVYLFHDDVMILGDGLDKVYTVLVAKSPRTGLLVDTCIQMETKGPRAIQGIVVLPK